MSHTADDTLSLTLPDWRTAARGVKRWKPPRPKSIMAACQLAGAIAFLAHDAWAGDWIGVAIASINVWTWWKWTWHGIPAFFGAPEPNSRGELPRLPDRGDWIRAGWVAFCILAFVLTVALTAAGLG